MGERFGSFARKLALGAALATGVGANEGCDDKKQPVEAHTEHSIQNITEDFFAIPLDQPLDSRKQVELTRSLIKAQEATDIIEAVQQSDLLPIEKILILQEDYQYSSEFTKLTGQAVNTLKFSLFKELPVTANEQREKILRKEILAFGVNNNKEVIQNMLREMGYSDAKTQHIFLDRESKKTGDKLRDLSSGQNDEATAKQAEQLDEYLSKIHELKEAL